MEAIYDRKWWVAALPKSSHGDPQVTMPTDASFIGWGCSIDNITSGVIWTPEEAQHDINYTEMFAFTLSLKSFTTTVSGKHVKLMVKINK